MSNARPIGRRPSFAVLLSIEGLLDGERSYARLMEFYVLSNSDIVQNLALPTTLTTTRIRAQIAREGDPDAESNVAQHLVDMVPQDIWDACIAAMSGGSPETCKQILADWIGG
jgi:hypothetical protein